MSEKIIFAHIVTYNHALYLESALEGLLSQDGFQIGKNLIIKVSDNQSSDNPESILKKFESRGVRYVLNRDNFGFAGTHNIGINEFLTSGADYYLCHNPDLCLEKNALKYMTESLSKEDKIGTVCPKLLRAGEDLKPLQPLVIDAAGMIITASLRHFDRGGEEADTGAYNSEELVFGASGACVLMKREYIEDVKIEQKAFDKDILKVYPAMQAAPERTFVFDEAFFAYREDADLAWRSQLFGWSCLYVPNAVGYHVRKVTPERRDNLPPEINLLGVKNRFLLQLNNYSLQYGLKVFLLGYVFRNTAVLLAVLFKERKSFKGLIQFLQLFRRGLDRRRIINSKLRVKHSDVRKWFK